MSYSYGFYLHIMTIGPNDCVPLERCAMCRYLSPWIRVDSCYVTEVLNAL